MEAPECPPTPPLLTEGLSSPKRGPASPLLPLKEAALSPRSGSPEPNCPICLGALNNKSYSDTCFHKFCFKCLLEWSKVKAECPLCKQKFKSIIHNVKSMAEYDQYTVQPTVAETQPAERLFMVTVDPWAMSPWFMRRHPVRRHAHLPPTVHRPGSALFQVFDMLPPAQGTRSHRTHRERTAVAARHAAVRGSAHPTGLDLRRSIYRNNLWAMPLADVTGRYREYSLNFYKHNPATTHRLLPWISRDLSALCDRAHIAVAMERINGLLLRHDMRSPDFNQEIREFLGQHTRHFVHELIGYARSPYDMMGYDREVTHAAWYHGLDDYSTTFQPENSSSDEDIMEVPLSPSRSTASRRYGYNSMSNNIPPLLVSEVYRPPTRTPSPEPGPSGVANRPSPNRGSLIPLLIDSSTDEEEAVNNGGSTSDVEVLAVLKPKHERTPEIVDLLSDSEGEAPVNQLAEEPWDPELASTSRVVDIPLEYLEESVADGPSTSGFSVNNSTNSGVKLEDIIDIEENFDFDAALNDLCAKYNKTGHPVSDSSASFEVYRKTSKHKKTKKRSKRRISTSSSDESNDRESKAHKKKKSCHCKDSTSLETRMKEAKSKKYKSHRQPERLRARYSNSSPEPVRLQKPLSSSNDEEEFAPKLKSKVQWKIRDLLSESSCDEAIYQPPRIRSIVVKRQPIIDSPGSSSMSRSHRYRSDSESSWEPSSKHTKKSKSKDKGKGKGKGKKRSA